MKRAGVRVYAAAEVPFLLAFGVPALLIGCVIGGVCCVGRAAVSAEGEKGVGYRRTGDAGGRCHGRAETK